MIDQASLDAGLPDGSTRTFCSWQAGWRSVLLRGYTDPPEVESFTTTPTSDQKIVLVVAGTCTIQAGEGGTWRSAVYRPGHIGLVAPRESAHLRWRSPQPHRTMQLHVPGVLIEHVADDLLGSRRNRAASLDTLSLVDPVVETAMRALENAAKAAAPDLYAETAAHFLVSHLLLRAGGRPERSASRPDETALRRVVEFMRSRLASDITLDELAGVAGVGRFQLLRMAKKNWNETPHRYLTRLRMEHAHRLLVSTRHTVIEIGLECGYANPTHFATAFKRFYGLSPSEFRRRG